MLLITKRRKIGAINGHTVYAISKSEMIPLPNSSVQSNIANSRNENRYKSIQFLDFGMIPLCVYFPGINVFN